MDIITQKSQQGFNLIELIIVIVVLGILLIGSGNLVQQGAASFFATQTTIQNNWQNGVALEAMIRDLRAIRSTADISIANATGISYTDINGDAIIYSVDGSGGLWKTINGVTQSLAKGMQNLTFNYYASAGVITTNLINVRYIVINLGAQNPIATIYLWNLDL